ncbi:MAG: hypothetical protein ACUVX9_06545 [Anaerolineae bacterium]
MEDSVFGGHHTKDYYYAWWAQLADQEYYATVEMRGDPNIQTDVDTFVVANELKFVLGQRPLSEWDAYVDELLHKYGAKDLLQATLEEMQRAGDKVTGIDPRIPL